MINKWLHAVLFCLVALLASAQENVLNGKVVSGKDGVPEAFVINKASGTETKTGADGAFSITAKPGDVLVVYSTRIMVREFMLSPDSFKNMPYVISVNYKTTEIEEVVITKYGNINSVSLGIVPANQKKFTVAERRLYTAGIGRISVDALINVISGRMRMLKRAYETEKQEAVFESVKSMYDEQGIEQDFNIPKEYVKGFMYYISENKELTIAINAKNKAYADFLVMGLAKEYLKLQQEGK